MKIGFDAQLFLKGNKTGIGWCADNLVKELGKSGRYEWQLNYFSKGNPKEITDALEEFHKEGGRLNPCPWFNNVLYKLLWPFIPLPYSWFFGRDCQITQFFNYVIPPGVKGKKVTIIYDMAHLACPQYVRPKTKHWLDLTVKQSCRRADAIVTISEFSRQEIIKYLGVPEEKITVMALGVDFSVYHNCYTQAQIDKAKNKYGIDGSYFLYLGTIEPRKNIERMIEAYALLKRNATETPKLVLAGGRGWLCDDIYRAAERLKIEESVLFTGYVDAGDAPLLISGAKAFLFPSLYEGFGLPPAEAMACGTPVLASHAASIPEVIGDAGLLVDPYSVEEIYRGMETLMMDETLRKRLSEKGLEQVKQFDWKNSAAILEKVYQKLAE